MTTGFKSYQEKLASAKFDSLIRCILNLNSEINRDESLGEGFIIDIAISATYQTLQMMN